jgi:hypothetical protein
VHVEQPVKHNLQELPLKKYIGEQSIQALEALEEHLEQPVKHDLHEFASR